MIEDRNDLKAKLKKQFTKNLWGFVDVLTVTISHDYFVERGDVVCQKSVNSFSQELVETLKKGKLANLNPVLDEVYKFKTEENTNFDAFDKFLIENGKFENKNVDKRKDFLNISVPIEIMWINVLPFIEHPSFIIEKAEIQTGLFRKEIK